MRSEHVRPRHPAASQPGPLAGLRIVDCSTVLAGPYCTMLLADLGADVVKVEPPEGDATRGWGPPWVGEGESRTAAYYLAANRNKRAIRLDLRREEGRSVLARLVERGDVLVENFRPGGFDRVGFDDRRLAALNPGLVHLAISGYGSTGPAAGRPGYDFLVQAQAGLMSITGFPDAEGGGPTKVGVAVSDLTTGMFGAIGVLAALAAREGRRRAGQPAGQRVDVSIFESTLAWLANQAQNYFATGRPPVRRGNAHPSIVPYETFATADGEIAVGVGSERQWIRFCEALGAPELAGDARFASNADRVRNRAVLQPLLEARFAGAATDRWLAALEAAEVPAAPINDLAAAFADPQVAAREMLVELLHPILGRVRQVGLPFKLSATPGSIRTPPPMIGEQSEEILAELGYAADEIARLRASGVV